MEEKATISAEALKAIERDIRKALKRHCYPGDIKITFRPIRRRLFRRKVRGELIEMTFLNNALPPDRFSTKRRQNMGGGVKELGFVVLTLAAITGCFCLRLGYDRGERSFAKAESLIRHNERQILFQE